MTQQQEARQRRVADVIQRELAKIVLQEMSDPRLVRMTISAVKLSRDLRNAKIYFMLPNSENAAAAKKILNQKTGSFLRAKLAEKVELRIIPELYFTYDDSLETGNRIEQLLDGSLTDNNKEK